MLRGKYPRTAEVREKNRTSSLNAYAKFPELRKRHSQKMQAKGWKRETHPTWKGGFYIEKEKGYKMIYDPSHPRARKNNYVLEHILVMEEMIGRALLPGEIVHHINGVKTDNRPGNLVLTNASEHAIKYDAHHPGKNRTCILKHCPNKHLARGYCRRHYRKMFCGGRDRLKVSHTLS